jgi:hypothetical protein
MFSVFDYSLHLFLRCTIRERGMGQLPAFDSEVIY